MQEVFLQKLIKQSKKATTPGAVLLAFRYEPRICWVMTQGLKTFFFQLVPALMIVE